MRIHKNSLSGHYEIEHTTECSWQVWSVEELIAQKVLMDKGFEFTNLCSIEVYNALPDDRYEVFVTRRYSHQVFVPHQYFGG